MGMDQPQQIVDKLTPKQCALGGYFLTMLMVATVLGMARQFGLLGFAIGVDLGAVYWILASISNASALQPFSNRKLSAVEIGTLVAICFILQGLALPPVQSGPHPRRPVAPLAPVLLAPA